MPADISAFFDPDTATVTYLLADPATQRAAVIDSVLDYDPASGRTSRRSADRLIAHLREHGLTLQWILETHVHADHVSAAPLLRAELGGLIGIGSNIPDVQRFMAPVFGTELPDRQPFDRLFQDDERFAVGTIEVRVMHTPGHTPACCTYVAEDAAFVGDTLFMPDFGTARCDFPGGDAHAMYRSIRRILELPPETRIFVGHDYPGDRRAAAWESTVAEQRAKNKHVHDGIDEDAFVAMRTERDKTLKLPTLILPAVQCNIRAGELPDPDAQGRRYLKVPLNTL
ncbi:MAG TPA: MBL fold metallo-hydrolase [Acetobacteraceae bacterium]|nr:MBL fold metallo-hydrolase [Acetobacteraceae bacterium]